MTSGKKTTSMLVIGVAMLLAACGGGGDSGTTAPPAAAAPLNGVFVDSPVQGLHYIAQPSNLSGFTDAQGQYNYRTGDTVIFDIGGRPLNTVGIPAGPVVTALSVFGATSTADPQVVNLSRLLLTLAGGAPNGNNVIQLPATLPPLPSPINFNVPTATFAANIAAAGGGTGPTLVPEATATTHLAANFFTVAVTLAGSGSGSVASTPSGITCGVTCSYVFSTATQVTLTPTGSGFAGWSSGTGSAAGCNGTNGACTFTPTSNSNITATFNVPPPDVLTILPNPGNGTGAVTCSNDGGATFGPCSTTYANGTALILKATANPGSTFTGWSNGTGNATACNSTTVNCSMTLNTNTTVAANFALQTATFTLTPAMTSAPGNGGGGTSITCSTVGAGGPFAPCAPSYNAGTNLWLQATPNSVSNFTGWSTGSGNGPGSPSACNGTSGICNFSVTEASSITANFNRPTLTVTVVGAGSVSSNPTGINTCAASCAAVFDRGTTITLTQSGAGFSGWTGGCSGTGACQFPLNTNTTVQAAFGTVSSGATFRFIAAPGRELLAVNPASPGVPIPVKVNGTNVILGNPPSAPGTTLHVSSGAALIDTASYNAATKTYTSLQRNTILFVSGGRVFKASTLVGDGVPGSALGNEPQQVSSISTAVSCGVGSVYDVVNPNQAVAFLAPGANGICYDSDDQEVLMHLNDSASSAPVILPAGTVLADTVYDSITGLALHAIVSVSGSPYWMDNSFTLTPIANGAGIGYAQMVAQQPDKVFVTNFTGLYLYTPSTHTLNPTPVVTPDPGTVFIMLDSDLADTSNIFLVQTNGDVYKVPLLTNPGTTITTKHFVAPAGTVVQDIKLTTNKIAIATGLRPSDNVGSFSPCYTSSPRTCNNGIIAVDKVTGVATTIEAAVSAKTLWLNQSFDNYILYTRNNDPAVGGLEDGAVLRIEDASSPAVLRGQFGGWGGRVIANSVSWVTLGSPTVRAVYSQHTAIGPPAQGTVSVISSPTGSPVLLGTVTSSPALNFFLPFFSESIETTMIGRAPLQVSPTNNQPFFIDAALAGSLTPITTPGAAARWQEVQD